MSSSFNSERPSNPTIGSWALALHFVEAYLISVEKQSSAIFTQESAHGESRKHNVDKKRATLVALRKLLPQWVYILQMIGSRGYTHLSSRQGELESRQESLRPLFASLCSSTLQQISPLATAAAAQRAEALFAWPHLSFVPSAWQKEGAHMDVSTNAAMETLTGLVMEELSEKILLQHKQCSTVESTNSAHPSYVNGMWCLWNALARLTRLSMLYASWAKLFLLYDRYALEKVSYITLNTGRTPDEAVWTKLPGNKKVESVLNLIKGFCKAFRTALLHTRAKAKALSSVPSFDPADNYEITYEMFDLAIRRELFGNCCWYLRTAKLDQESATLKEYDKESPSIGKVLDAPANCEMEESSDDYSSAKVLPASVLADIQVSTNLWFVECCRVVAKGDVSSFQSDCISLQLMEQLVDFVAKRTCEEVVAVAKTASDLQLNESAALSHDYTAELQEGRKRGEKDSLEQSGRRFSTKIDPLQEVNSHKLLRVGFLAAVSMDSPLTPSGITNKPIPLAHGLSEPAARTHNLRKGNRQRKEKKEMIKKRKPRRKSRRSPSFSPTSSSTSVITSDSPYNDVSSWASRDDSDGTASEEQDGGRFYATPQVSLGAKEIALQHRAESRSRTQCSAAYRCLCEARLAGMVLTTAAISNNFEEFSFDVERHARGGTFQWLAPCSNSAVGIASLTKPD